MKKMMLLAAIAATLGACSAGQNLTQALNKAQGIIESKCPKHYVKSPITGDLEIVFECDSLWPTEAIRQKCTVLELCADVAGGKITSHAKCDSLLPIPKIELK